MSMAEREERPRVAQPQLARDGDHAEARGRDERIHEMAGTESPVLATQREQDGAGSDDHGPRDDGQGHVLA